MRFAATVTCSRPGAEAWSDGFGNTQGEARPAVTFEAVFVPPTTQAGSQIIDAANRQQTITKPTLFIDRRPANLPALEPGAIVSGDSIIIGGETGWEVDGDPAQYTNPFTRRPMPLVVELRKADG